MILKDIKKYLPFIYIVVMVIFFMARIIFFAETFGGIEHDSGWYLGVAKNLAHRGIYASYTNTIKEQGKGAYSSIHGRFSVQDENGYSYFPAGVTVGPGYVVPQAILLKIFGNGWWQYRLWPLLTFIFLIYLLFYTIWKIGGKISLLFFVVWFWAVPQLTMQFAYEAYSEHIALLFLFLSFLLYYFSIKKNGNLFIFLSGLFLSFSFLTKNLFFVSAAGFLVPLLWEIWRNKKNIRYLFFRWSLFGIAFVLPIGLFELYRYLYLTSHFGYEGWVAVNKDIQIQFKTAGSGITDINFSNLDWTFILKKINIWLDVGVEYSFLVWIILSLSPFILFKYSPKRFKILIALIYASLLFSFLWYVFISTTGWARHTWQGIVLGMAIVSMSIGLILKTSLRNLNKSFVLVLTLIIVILTSLNYQIFDVNFFLNRQDINKWMNNRNIRGLQGFPSNPILSLEDQKGLIDFFKKNINEKDKVYYAGWFINAEASPLVNKVFYTLDRYFTLGQINPDGGNSYLILGPYQQGPWSFEPPDYVRNKTQELCEKQIFSNSSYSLCLLQHELVYNNPAY